jgi:anaphase-promoting complex subunit 3
LESPGSEKQDPPDAEAEASNNEQALLDRHGGVENILELLCLMGAGYWKLCQYRCREAMQLFQTLPQEQRNTGWVLHQEGRAFFEMANYQNAQRSLELMQSVEPHRMKGLELLSTVLWQLKKEVEIAHLAQKVVDFDRLAPEAWCVVGNCFSLQKEHETALVFFSRSLQLNPSFTYVHTLSGYEYMANEDFEKAVACFRNAIRSDERHYNAWYGIGAIYHRQEKYDLAEYHFHRAVTINPQSSVLRCNLGMSQYSNGKPLQALDTLAEAFRLDPHNPQARFQRATIYVSLNRSEDALKELEKVRDAAPREATVHFAMGKVLKRLGRPEQAMRCFLTALDLDPKDNQLIKSAMDKLDEPDIDEEVTAF